MPERPNKKAVSLGHGQSARKLAGMNAISADEVTAESVPLGWTLQADGYGKAVWAPPPVVSGDGGSDQFTFFMTGSMGVI